MPPAAQLPFDTVPVSDRRLQTGLFSHVRPPPGTPANLPVLHRVEVPEAGRWSLTRLLTVSMRGCRRRDHDIQMKAPSIGAAPRGRLEPGLEAVWTILGRKETL
jgi:hypothetical protein